MFRSSSRSQTGEYLTIFAVLLVTDDYIHDETQVLKSLDRKLISTDQLFVESALDSRL